MTLNLPERLSEGGWNLFCDNGVRRRDREEKRERTVVIIIILISFIHLCGYVGMSCKQTTSLSFIPMAIAKAEDERASTLFTYSHSPLTTWHHDRRKWLYFLFKVIYWLGTVWKFEKIDFAPNAPLTNFNLWAGGLALSPSASNRLTAHVKQGEVFVLATYDPNLTALQRGVWHHVFLAVVAV